ncbi:GntR family transcriptional regulator [Amnibacterium kyonggiense]|uniref:GntR family transcriptional regulator n=2 Tax=Amnibacterium kyonggiense TaxID=595671 RepID=A0A4V6Q108_9MICO|nr:GntR family transcriptional regulator [Amnibacterium kyonggiense]
MTAHRGPYDDRMTDRGPDRPSASRSQTDVVVEGVKAMIVDGELRPGDRLPVEKDLAARLGVSRGSLREGVRALATLGVLQTRQGDGTYVTSLDAAALLGPVGLFAELRGEEQAHDLLGVRRVLEAESAARAARLRTEEHLVELRAILAGVDDLLRSGEPLDAQAFIEADTRFHAVVARASGSPTLAALIDGLVGRTLRARLWRAITQQHANAETQREHRAVLAEIEAGEPERARVRMSVHVLGVEEYADAHDAEGYPPA